MQLPTMVYDVPENPIPEVMHGWSAIEDRQNGLICNLSWFDWDISSSTVDGCNDRAARPSLMCIN
jgi:hypothetical protein